MNWRVVPGPESKVHGMLLLSSINGNDERSAIESCKRYRKLNNDPKAELYGPGGKIEITRRLEAV